MLTSQNLFSKPMKIHHSLRTAHVHQNRIEQAFFTRLPNKQDKALNFAGQKLHQVGIGQDIDSSFQRAPT
jgi:hypothetical protein